MSVSFYYFFGIWIFCFSLDYFTGGEREGFVEIGWNDVIVGSFEFRNEFCVKFRFFALKIMENLIIPPS